MVKGSQPSLKQTNSPARILRVKVAVKAQHPDTPALNKDLAGLAEALPRLELLIFLTGQVNLENTAKLPTPSLGAEGKKQILPHMEPTKGVLQKEIPQHMEA